MSVLNDEKVRLGLLGAGAVGRALSDLFRRAGHDIVVGSRSGGASLADAARHGDIVIVAVPYAAASEVLPPLRQHLRGKVVVDATNPLGPDWAPLLLGDENSAGEEISRLLPETRVVKAFNTVFADAMTPERLDRDGRSATLFVAGDDEAACDATAALGRSVGFAPMITGPLRLSRYLEAMAHLNIAIAASGGTNAAFLYDQQ